MAEDVIPFRLLDGQCGEIAREARCTYDAIISSNLGVPLRDGLTDDQVRTILLKSRLPEDVIEHIWSLTEQIDGPGRDDGTWSQLEVYVTLNFVQAQERLSLDAMQSQFAGAFRFATNKITRRTSFAPAAGATIRNSLPSPAFELPTIISRSQSSSSKPNLQDEASVEVPTIPSSQVKLKAKQSLHAIQDHEALTVNHGPRRRDFSLEIVEDLEGNLYGDSPQTQPESLEPNVSIANEIIRPQSSIENSRADQANRRKLRSLHQVERGQGPWSPLAESDDNHRKVAPPMRLVSDSVMSMSGKYPSASLKLSPSDHLLPRSQTVTSSSSRESTPAEKRQRLANLTAASNHKLVIAPVLSAPGPAPRFGSTIDEYDARNLLVAQREGTKQPGSGFGSLLRSKSEKEKAKDKSTWTFSKNEHDQALKKVIEQGRGVGIVEALLDLGADPNTFQGASEGRLKRVRQKDITATPGRYIQIAASHNQADVVRLLAYRGAWPDSVSEALTIAVQHRHLEVVRVLLEHKADPNFGKGSAFRDAMSSHNATAIRLLLQARVPVSKDLLDGSLLRAVESEDPEIVSLLVANKADVNHAHAAALCKSVELGRPDLLIALMRGKPNAESASIAFEHVLAQNYLLSNRDVYLIVDLLLCAGASGIHVDEALIRVVNAGQKKLTLLLVDSGSSVNYQEGRALKRAVHQCNLDLVKILLNAKVDSRLVSQAFKDIPQPFDEKSTYQIMSALLHRGASGEPVTQALPCAVEHRQLRLIALLLDADASIYYQDANALRTAIAAGDTDVVDLLLRRTTSQPLPTQLLLPLVPRNPTQVYHELTTRIIRLGVSASALHDAFIRATDHESHTVHIPVVKALLSAGIDINRVGKKALQDATSTADIELLDALLQCRPDDRLISCAIPKAMNVETQKLRLQIVTLLMSHRAKGKFVAQALVKVLREEPIQHDLLRVLLEDKTSVDSSEGQIVTIAAQAMHQGTLELTLTSGKPEGLSCVNALDFVMNPSTCERYEKLRLLLKQNLPKDAVHEALIKEAENSASQDLAVTRILIDHGASCDYRDGRAVEKAIQNQQLNFLEFLLSAGEPSASTLSKRISTVAQVPDRRNRYAMMNLLLNRCNKGPHLGNALLEEINRKEQADALIVELLTSHGANVNCHNGAAMKSVVTHPARPDLLKILLQAEIDVNSLSSTIPIAMANDANIRHDLMTILLAHGASGLELNKALIVAVTEGDRAFPLIQLLLQYNASLDFDGGKAVIEATSQGCISTLQLLLSYWPKPQAAPLAKAFRSAMQLPVLDKDTTKPLRGNIVEELMRYGTGYFSLEPALLQACSEGDHHLIKYLINQGADPNFNHGKCLKIAAQKYDLISLRYLLTPDTGSAICSECFTCIADHQDRARQVRVFIDMAKLLLKGGAAGRAVDYALVEAINGGSHPESQLLESLLTATPGPNVDFLDGKCLRTAVEQNSFELTRRLLNRNPSLQTLSIILPFIFDLEASEGELQAMTQLFLDHAPRNKHTLYSSSEVSSGPLYQCLHLHPDKPQLLQLLIDNECPASTLFSWEFDKSIGPEELSPLLWLLCQADSNVDPNVYKILLEHNDINFRAPQSGITPLTVASAHASPDLIQDILQKGANVNSEDHAGRNPLYFAAAAGAIDNMKLLIANGSNCNDESLHIAARNLEVSVVELLLKHGADVNRPGFISSDGRTPLGELCRHGDCKDNPLLVKAALQALFEASPDVHKTVEGKSVLLLALDNPSPYRMTKILLSATTHISSTINDDANIFKASNGRCYSPTMYVRLRKAPRSPAQPQSPRNGGDRDQDLEKLLRAFGCQDRFWDDKSGADQPNGSCGEPPHIKEAQHNKRLQLEREAEDARVRQREQDRLQAEQKRLEAIRAQKEADEARRRQRREERLREEQQREQALRARREADEVRKRRLREERRAEQRAEAEEEEERERQRLETERAARVAEEAFERRLRKERRDEQRAEAREETLREQRRLKARQEGREAEFESDKRRFKAMMKEVEDADSRRAGIRERSMRNQADIFKGVLREQQRLADNSRDARFAELMLQGAGGGSGNQRRIAGRRVQELEDWEN